MKKKYYVVWNGADTGVFDSWDECKLQINGYPGAKYKSFDSLEAAIEAYRGNPSDHLGLFRAMARQSVRHEINYESFPEIHLNAIAVDAACSHNPGPVEYQAPSGTIRGTVSLKRQFEIKESTLNYFFDSDLNIVDNLLREALSHNTSPQTVSYTHLTLPTT